MSHYWFNLFRDLTSQNHCKNIWKVVCTIDNENVSFLQWQQNRSKKLNSDLSIIDIQFQRKNSNNFAVFTTDCLQLYAQFQ